MIETPLAIGIDFSCTSVKVGVIYRSNVITHAPPIATKEFDGPEPLIDAIIKVVEDLHSRHPGVAAVGIGVPGCVDFEKGVVHSLTNVPGWNGIRLKSILAERLKLPIVVENDANCMTYAEWKRGAGRGLDHIVAVTLGAGVGGGVVANGKMVRGSRFGAGEIGQMSIEWQGVPGSFGNLGALEEYIGNLRIASDADEAYAKTDTPRPASECTPVDLSKLARRGDPIALDIWDQVATKLATALMNCCWLLNPQAIIVGGGMARAGDLLFGPLTSHLYAQLSAPFKDHLMVLPARFGNEAGMVGAAALSLEAAGVVISP